MIPTGTNMHGIIYSSNSKEDIAKKFEAYGWQVSKASWFDWEITNEFSELIIEGDNEILIHGPISPDCFEVLAKKMKEMELRFLLEFYDESHNLITEIKN